MRLHEIRKSDAGLHQSCDHCRSSGDPELGKDSAHVTPHGMFADAEMTCDLLRTLATSNENRDLSFPLGQDFPGVVFGPNPVSPAVGAISFRNQNIALVGYP